jgi:hypothetical protein
MFYKKSRENIIGYKNIANSERISLHFGLQGEEHANFVFGAQK